MKIIPMLFLICSLTACFPRHQPYSNVQPSQVVPNAYGYGVHMDRTGRAIRYYDQYGRQVYGPVQRNGYGLGVHMDQYGRPVYQK